MNIAFIITNKSQFNISHYNNQETGRGKALVDAGYNVDIYVFDFQKRSTQVVYKKADKRLRVIPYKGVKIVGNQTIPINLKSKLKKEKYTYAHLHEYPWVIPWLIGRFLRRRGTKTILVQGMYEDFRGRSKRMYNKLYDFLIFPRLIKVLNGMTFKTQIAHKYIVNKGAKGLPATVIPIGLDTHHFETSTGESPLNKFLTAKIQQFSKTLLYIGSIEERRNPRFIIDILSDLVKNDSSFGLVIVGKGPLLDELLEYICLKNVQEYVVTVNSLMQEQLPWIYRNADMFLLPSSYEIFGMVLLESFYFGLSVLSSPTAGALEVIPSFYNGYVKPLEKDVWVKTIELHFKNSTNSVQIRNKYHQRYEWSTIAKEFISFYDEL